MHFCHEEAQQLAALVTGGGAATMWARFHWRRAILWFSLGAFRASILVQP